MPRFVHLADERDAKKILKNGIKPGKGRTGVYCLPVTGDFYASHQWLRELKRGGIRTMVAVCFKMNSKEQIWFGKYFEKHQKMEVGAAIRQFREAEDKMGFECLIERKIEAKEITSVKKITQNIGWRYFPESHTKKLSCGCPICINYGGIKSKKKREKFKPSVKMRSFDEIVQQLKTERNRDEVDALFWELWRKKRKANPEIFRFIIDRNYVFSIQLLANALSSFKHPNTGKMLLELCNHKDDEVKRKCVESIFEIDSANAIQRLKSFEKDETIQKIIHEITE